MMKAKSALQLGLVTLAVGGLMAVARAQGEKEGDPARKDDAQQRIEYVRVPLYSVFHPDPKSEAKLERGLYIGGPRSNDQTFRLPVEVPVGATILEVGIVGQTSNQMIVRLERTDWTPVYAFGETNPRENGSWEVMSVVDHAQVRKVGKPVPNEDNYKIAKREHEEQEFVVQVSLARSPGLTDAQKAAHVSAQQDKVTAVWLKIAR